MAERYDILVAIETRGGTTMYRNIGTMFPMKDREGFVARFVALPLPQIGRDGKLETVTIILPQGEDPASEGSPQPTKPRSRGKPSFSGG